VANLLLARAMRRRRETAVRLALGVGRGRLVATVLAESLLLALLGGLAAVALATLGGDLVREFLLPDIAWDSAGTPFRVLLFSFAIAVLAGVLAAAVPAIRAGRPRVTEALRSATRSVTRARSRLRSGLLVLQAAISVVLLVGTALFALSLRTARDVDLGFAPEHVLLVRLEAEGGYPGAEAMTRLYRQAREQVRLLPGVRASAISSVVPFRNSRGIGDDLRVPGLDSLPRTRAGGAYIHAVTGEYFETMGLEVLRGRPIAEMDDEAGSPRVAVVNQTMAELVWPDRDPLGRCLIIRDAPCATVVGVVEDHHRFDLTEERSMHYYVPLAHAPYPWPPSGLLVHASRPELLAGPVQRELQGAIGGVRLVTANPFRETIDPHYRAWTLGSALFGGFGLLALLVAAIGLYSVLAFDVAERRPELGIRSALGASRGGIVGVVVAQGLRVAAAGVAIGVGVAVLLGGWVQPLLFGVDARRPGALASVAVAVLLVCVAATAVPAWRAARVDPNEALRAE